ncbi:MAG: flagellar motor switch protein FliM [Anaerovibrio sp.]|uniref:flagellar motor switch protein FliM n=1 Tax=uncultured Anaerovibrio sp. TaxID=361586 RepID=UPI0025F572DD|nr:flagellar motor switch protein FliM [uncultured Anaerovibrio sp.]MBQ1854961.1 flagellar motor switch protein FliM [Anaerovibrio sp.]
MADDVLSQSEIDKLLAQFASGEADAETMQKEESTKKIKTYDFKRPDKFSKDQIRTLNMLHDNFARLFNTYLSTYLRALVSVEVASVEQLTYQEFVQSLSNPSVIGILAVPPLKGNIIMEMNSGIAFSIIDRVFGGQGENTINPRVLTEIEEAVIRRIFDKALGHLREAWFNVVQFNPKIEAIESNPQFAQIVPPSDMVVIITLQTKIGGAEGFMNICIPYLVLEPIMSKLTTTFWVAANISKEEHPEHEDMIRQKLRKTKVPVIIQMGQFDISVREFLSLSYGDVLQLDTRVDDELKCIVGNNTKFYCRPGTSGKKAAVQITRLITEGDEGTNG